MTNALSKDVDEIVFMTDNADYSHNAALIIQEKISWIFMFIECLFRAPTFPITAITSNGPIYAENFNIYELFYIETAN